jgi:gliding motility-associated-like protein
LFIFFQSELLATHIVGGELEFIHVGRYTYNTRLILYFDQINGNPGAEDNNINIGIFSKSLNSLIDTFLLPKTQTDFVQYSFPDCAIPALNTKRIIYSRILVLDSITYSDPAGYYLAWDRCCRNNGINNLTNPGIQGQLFYLEVPPIYKNGSEFINSTPVLFPPVSDYACRGDLFYYDFQGTDLDGDSLVYSMISPLKGLTDQFNPLFVSPLPGPYPEVIWDGSHGFTTMINGTPPLNITPGGFLTVKPSEIGLFVFGVKCEEFRNGLKIGEVRRDFQILVINCPTNDPPVIAGQNPVTDSSLFDGDTIFISMQDRCFAVEIWDPDSNTKMTLETIAVNFDSSFISPGINKATAVGTDTILTEVCFSKCAITETEPYEFWVIVSDDGCALPKKDTIRLFAFVEGFGFQIPEIFSDLNSDTLKGYVGEEIKFNVSAVDTRNDSIELILTKNYFDPFYLGAIFPGVSGTDTITSEFSWIPDCRILDEDSAFLIFKAFDHICSNYDSLYRLPFDIRYRKYNPDLSTSLENDEIVTELLEAFRFTVFAKDSNTQEVLQVFIKILDENGNQIPPGPLSYDPKTAIGSLESQVYWEPGCDYLPLDSGFLKIVVFDNGCEQGADSVDIKTTFSYSNQPPELEIPEAQIISSGQNEVSIPIHPIDTTILLDLIGFDGDSDLVILSAKGIGFQLSDFQMDFSTKSNFRVANGSFSWTVPGCEILTEKSPIDLVFGIRDNACEVISDSLLVHFFWENPWKDLHPPNVVTPNGDGLNDNWSLQQLKAPCGFKYISIYNRWGQEIYYSENPEFVWNPDRLAAGHYMYHMVFDNFQQKGFVNLLR